MSKLSDWLAEDDAPEPRADNQSFQMEDWWDGWKAARERVRVLLKEDEEEQKEIFLHPKLGVMSTSVSVGTIFTSSRQYDER